jgi:ribonucleoside-diphosphate reductase beta chain
MDSNWFSLKIERRNGIKYISENFYPEKYMKRWETLKQLSLNLSEIVKGYSITQISEEIEHFNFFKNYFQEDPLNFELPESYLKWFDELLESFKLGKIDDIAVRFHMLTEGVLATVGLNILNEQSTDLTEFNSNIKRLIMDEARHINYGFQLIKNREYAIMKIDELYPSAEKIIKDGMGFLEPLGYSWKELRDEMEKLKNSRIYKLKTM